MVWSSLPGPGHIFVLNTDVRNLACDGWLCPVGSSMDVEEYWRIRIGEVPLRPDGWGVSELCVRCDPKSATERAEARSYEHPQPYLAYAMGIDSGNELEVLEATLNSFLTMAHKDLQAREAAGVPSRFGRALPLLALPIFGAGFAANDALKGNDNGGVIILQMLRQLHAFTSTHHVDIALCTVDEAAFGAAQTARRFLFGDEVPELVISRWSRLWRLKPPREAADPEQYFDEVERLAERFSDGQVSLFLGAGVSINAGLPSWTQLLDLLAVELDMQPRERAALAQLNPLEAASILGARAGGERELKRRCARILATAKRHSLQHALLAGLPFKGVVTTNYDELFELAVRGAGADMVTLPAGIGSVRDRWCLKLHGTCSLPESIVLTRRDYSVFAKEQAASESLLQALLMTQHVYAAAPAAPAHRSPQPNRARCCSHSCLHRLRSVFVGFSMRDENWCRIVETVRSSLELGARPPADAAEALDVADNAEKASSALGTMLPLERDALFDSLWEGSHEGSERPVLHITSMGELIGEAMAPSEDEARGRDHALRGGRDGAHSAESGLPTRWSHVAQLARQLEIFLDHVASAVESRHCRILLNSKYKQVLLSPRSRALAEALECFLDQMPPHAKEAGAFQPLLQMLLWMGLRTESARSLFDNPTLEGPYRRRLGKLLDHKLARDAESRRRRSLRASPLVYMQ